MSADSPTIPPNYVRCFCQQCGQPIEFDGSQFEEREMRTVSCPHCGKEAVLFIPQPEAEPVPAQQQTPKAAPEAKQNLPWAVACVAVSVLQTVASLLKAAPSNLALFLLALVQATGPLLVVIAVSAFSSYWVGKGYRLRSFLICYLALSSLVLLCSLLGYINPTTTQ